MTSVAAPSREPNASQRALLVSVGALALSVVAMTTMFIFVYSHGERALEVPVAARSAAALANARQPLPEVARATLPAPLPPLVETAAQCTEHSSPIAPASVLDPPSAGPNTEVEVRALRPTGSQPRGFAGQALDGALPCE